MRLPKAILFDLDDTIISYEGVSGQAWKDCTRAFVQKYRTDADEQTLLAQIDRVRKWFWSDPERHKAGRMDMMGARRKIVSLALAELGQFSEEQAFDLADSFSIHRNELVCLFPNSIRTLCELKERGIRLGLITNGTVKEQGSKMNRFQLAPFFEVCLIEEAAGFGKPDVRIYRKALELLSLKEEEVWMVGDNLVWDIQAPQGIGIYSIWNDYQKTGLPEGLRIHPDRTVHEISELLF